METAVSKNRYLKQLKDGWVKDEPYVFVSYASRDWEKVYPTVLALRALGINVYIDVEFMENQSSSWLDNFQDQMIWNMDCVGIVTFLSISYLRSYACLMEQLANRTSIMRERRGGPLPVFYMALEPEMETVQRMQQYIYSKEVAKEGRARVKMQPPEAALFQEFILKCGYSQYPDADAVRNMLGEIRDQHAVVTKAYWLIFEDLQYLIRPFCSPGECAEQLAGNFTNHKNASILMMPSEELKQETLRRLSGEDEPAAMPGAPGQSQPAVEAGPESGTGAPGQGQPAVEAEPGSGTGAPGQGQPAVEAEPAGRPFPSWMEELCERALNWDLEAACQPGMWFDGKALGQETGPVVRAFLTAAEQGYAAAQNVTGHLCRCGLVDGQGEEQAVEWYRKAAVQGYADAQDNLGTCYTDGLGVETDVPKGVRWYQRAAEQGYAPAQNNLGYCYLEEELDEMTTRAGVEWLRNMAARGDITAKRELASMWKDEGTGAEETVEGEIRRLEMAAARGNAAAQNSLGVYYGYGMDALSAEGVNWLKKAAAQGYALAQRNLSYCYENGVGVEQDYGEALKTSGEADAGESVGTKLESYDMEKKASGEADAGESEVRLPDWMEELCERALDWDIEEDGYTPGMWFDGKAPGREIKAVVDAFYAAAKQGCAAAQNVTGHCCMCGLIEGQGKKQAVEWYRKAAEQKYAPAQKNLGDYYGGVCDEDEEETIRIGAKWLRRMANEGEKEAKSRLCSNWERSGIGKNETVEEELEYLNHAAAQGNAAAEDVLNDYYIAGMLKACPWEMMEWNKKAAEQGYAPAWQTLGYCYEHGVGVEQDARKAAESYEKADALRRAAIRE